MTLPQALLDAFENLPWQPPTLRTERLLLRALRPSDAPFVYAYAKEPEVARYVAWEPHASLDDSIAFLRDFVAPKYREGVPEPFGIERLAEPGRLIGCVGAFWVNQAQHEMEMGYVLHQDFWGQGLMPEAAAAVLDHAFAEHPVWRVRCRCKVENPKSLRVMEKVGYRHEGIARGSWWVKGRVWDMHMTALLRPDWPGAPATMPKTGPLGRR